MATAAVGAAQRACRKCDAPPRSWPMRAGIFLLGLVLNLLGAAAWLLSVLLMAPLMLAGLWIWSHEFHWAGRLLERVRVWAKATWRRVKERPVRWGVSTATSLSGTATAYWLWMF